MFGTKWKFNKGNLFVDKRGFTIVEIIVVVAIIASAFIAILSFFVFESRVGDRERMRLKAISLAEETIEAVRNFRDNTDWAVNGIGTLSTGVEYHTAKATSSWEVISGSEDIDGFTKVIIFTNVSRDGNDNIEQIFNPLNHDPDTKKISIIVNWADRSGSASESIETYLTNWRR